MFSLVVIILLALLLLAYVAIPLLFRGQTDALPDPRDPVTLDLEEERDALFRAIRELELREDLPAPRRETLRARYEAKAAKVLRALDERGGELAGRARPTPAPRPRRAPYAALSLLGGVVVTAVVMSGFVLPRVGENGTVTTTDVAAAKQLQALQKAAAKDPNETNLLTLGDAYWSLQEADSAEATYLQITQTITPAPAVAYRRLGFLKLQTDLAAALPYLEEARAADPGDLDTLFTLGELYFSLARPKDAVAALEAFLARPDGAGDAEVQARLETFQTLAPVLDQATADPTEGNLLALADAYWNVEERERAADIYVRVLSTFDPHSAVALSRIGQVLFFSGRTDEAVDLLERAEQVDATDLTTLLFLGNAYFTQERFQDAIDTWQSYVTTAGGEVSAGRVPSLIENARARLAEAGGATGVGVTSVGVTDAGETGGAVAMGDAGESIVQQVSAQGLYTANCAGCHGVQGQGGTGPTLAGNRNAARAENVRSVIQYGRGSMPGFGATLSEEQLTVLTDYVVNTVSTGQTQAERPENP